MRPLRRRLRRLKHSTVLKTAAPQSSARLQPLLCGRERQAQACCCGGSNSSTSSIFKLRRRLLSSRSGAICRRCSASCCRQKRRQLTQRLWQLQRQLRSSSLRESRLRLKSTLENTLQSLLQLQQRQRALPSLPLKETLTLLRPAWPRQRACGTRNMPSRPQLQPQRRRSRRRRLALCAIVQALRRRVLLRAPRAAA